ncbi:YnfU family zinc-binding protein [Pectobacterium brasiliense]|uniref:YnfU family zinc-binding protein n=1 Tax=Pectobacterium brasiliense TaxID=180957 RepID=UPI003015F95A
MSLIDYATKLIGGSSTSSVICPVCGLRSSQILSRVRRQQTMLCPGCKALFVLPHSS